MVVPCVLSCFQLEERHSWLWRMGIRLMQPSLYDIHSHCVLHVTFTIPEPPCVSLQCMCFLCLLIMSCQYSYTHVVDKAVRLRRIGRWRGKGTQIRLLLWLTLLALLVYWSKLIHASKQACVWGEDTKEVGICRGRVRNEVETWLCCLIEFLSA